MVSINPPLSSSTQRTKFPQALMESLSRKRKFDDDNEAFENGEILMEKSLFKSMKSMISTDLHLDSPLPLEWQRCLDIKSGQIYFYNTRTHKRTSTDPRLNYQEPKSPSSSHVISLDLELNLPCSTPLKINDNFTNDRNLGNTTSSLAMNPKKTGTTEMSRSTPSWLASEGDQQEHQEEEMVAAVCNKCHMLVIMCKISPSCPNCKFMHESSTTASTLFKRRSLSLLC